MPSGSTPPPVLKGTYTGTKFIATLEAMTVAELPAAADGRMMVFVADEAGGGQPCYSDLKQWRRCSDDRVVSVLDTEWIIQGQSNAASIVPVTIGYSAMTYYLNGMTYGWSDTAAKFVPLVDGSANSKANTGGLGTGAGPGAGQIGTRLLHWISEQTGRVVRCFALAYTGQDIDYFRKNSATKAFYENGTQNASLNNYNLMLSYVAASGIRPTRYLFAQGEANAGNTQASYYAKLRELFLDTQTDYPGIKWTLIRTIGANTVGVGLAQKQLADEYPEIITLIDNSDMYPNATAYYRDPHYTTYLGYEKVTDRIKASLTGSSQPTIEQATYLGGIAFANLYQYVRSVAGTDPTTGLPQLVVWQDSIGVKSLSGDGSHVAASADFNRRSVTRLIAASSDGYALAGTGVNGDSWTVFGIGQLSDLTPVISLFEIRDASAANRFGLQVVGGSAVANLWYDGASQAFAGSPTYNTSQVSWGLVVDTPNLLASLYLNGLLVSTVVIDGSESIVNANYYLGSLSDAAQFFPGDVAMLAIAPGVVATAAQMAAAHAWGKLEYGLPV